MKKRITYRYPPMAEQRVLLDEISEHNHLLLNKLLTLSAKRASGDYPHRHGAA